MDQKSFQDLLKDLNLGKVAYLPSTTSTNDVAAEWVKQGVPDFSLIAADSQTKGRGRSGRTWHTYPGSALAFSLILVPNVAPQYFPRYTALGALGVCHAIKKISDTPALIKWPNDVLVENKKVAGILTEVIWSGDHPEAVIIGIGVNISRESLPIDEKLNYPAGYLAEYSQQPPDRFQVLYNILFEMKVWHSKIDSESFTAEWERLLAFRNQEIEVLIHSPHSTQNDKSFQKITGRLAGIDQNGMLLVKLIDGKIKSFAANEIKILPKE